MGRRNADATANLASGNSLPAIWTAFFEISMPYFSVALMCVK
jgi:hypothetical protein